MTVINGINMKEILQKRRSRSARSEEALKQGLKPQGFYHLRSINHPIQTYVDRGGVCYCWDEGIEKFVKLSVWLSSFYLTKEGDDK